MAPTSNLVYTVFAFIGLFICVFLFPAHVKAKNSGTCLYVFWVSLGCLFFGVNSILWSGNTTNKAPIWCEIGTRLFLTASSFGIPATSLCINRRLYLVQRAVIERRKVFDHKVWQFDLAVGLGVPLLSLPLYYISQTNRFNILEDIGCIYAIYISWVALVTLNAPPLIMGIIAAFYATRNIIFFNRMRSRFRVLPSSNMTYSLYVRLMALATTEVVCTIPITLLYCIPLPLPYLPRYDSWAAVHADYDNIPEFPGSIWRTTGLPAHKFELDRWLYVVCAFLFFALFGWAEEVGNFYGPILRYICRRLGIRRNETGSDIVFKVGSIFQSTRTTNLAGNAETVQPVKTINDVEMGEKVGDSSVELGGPDGVEKSSAPEFIHV